MTYDEALKSLIPADMAYDTTVKAHDKPVSENIFNALKNITCKILAAASECNHETEYEFKNITTEDKNIIMNMLEYQGYDIYKISDLKININWLPKEDYEN